MSTRSQVIIVSGESFSGDEIDEMWFYRHSDGYPSGNMPQLYKFMKWREEGRIRDNVEQSCGWLVLIGAEEYDYMWSDSGEKLKKKKITEPSHDSFSGWKCGAYEPCPCRTNHGDIEWLYTIDIKENSIIITNFDKTKKYSFEELKTWGENDNWEELEQEFK
jgi:hypothetical protein